MEYQDQLNLVHLLSRLIIKSLRTVDFRFVIKVCCNGLWSRDYADRSGANVNDEIVNRVSRTYSVFYFEVKQCINSNQLIGRNSGSYLWFYCNLNFLLSETHEKKKKTYFLLRRNISPKKEMANSQLDHLTWPLQVFTFESKHSAVDVVAIGLEEGYKKWSISKILVSYNI